MKIRNLAIRLMIGVLAIEVTMLSLLVANSVRVISSSHANRFEAMVSDELRLLESAVSSGLIYNDRAMLNDTLSLLSDREDLIYAAVYNQAGEVLADLGDLSRKREPDSSFKTAREDNIYDVMSTVTVEEQPLGKVALGISIDEIRGFTLDLQVQSTLIAVAELVLSMLLTVWVGLRVARRIDALQYGATQLRYGHLGYRVPVEGEDELSQLGTTLNQLASHLETTRVALESEHRALETESERLNTLVNSVNAVIFEASANTMDFNFVSQEAATLLGYAEEDWYRHGFWNRIIHQEDRVKFWSSMGAIQDLPQDIEVDYRVFDRTGKVIWIRYCATVEHNSKGKRVARGFLLNITDEKRAQERVSFFAEHDALTALFNRRRFKEELERSLLYTKRYNRSGAILFIDIDQFKYVNDTLGHQAGDQYLIQVSNCLKKNLRESDVLARLGGDEFGVVLPESDAEHAMRVAQLILDKLNQTQLNYRGAMIQVSASIGIALFPQHGEISDELLARADTAMYIAKQNGRNRCHLYSDDDSDLQSMADTVHWDTEIRNALKEDRLQLYFQPVVDLRNNSILHYEVLLRMRDGDGNLVLPGAFLDTAERFGLIREIDTWVVRRTMEYLADWPYSIDSKPLAVNLSGRYFGSDVYLEMIKSALEQTVVDPRMLLFEVTETAAIENIASAQRFIRELKTLGCRFALDDFGVGFASFQYLKHLELDYVKVDGSFIRNLHEDRQDKAFVRAIYDMAEGLGIDVIAEFVENQQVVTELSKIGINLAQGFYLGKPASRPLEMQVSAVS